MTFSLFWTIGPSFSPTMILTGWATVQQECIHTRSICLLCRSSWRWCLGLICSCFSRLHFVLVLVVLLSCCAQDAHAAMKSHFLRTWMWTVRLHCNNLSGCGRTCGLIGCNMVTLVITQAKGRLSWWLMCHDCDKMLWVRESFIRANGFTHIPNDIKNDKCLARS